MFYDTNDILCRPNVLYNTYVILYVHCDNTDKLKAHKWGLYRA